MSRIQKNSRKAHNFNFSSNSNFEMLKKLLRKETLDSKKIENLDSQTVKWPQSTYRIQKQFRAKNGETERQARESRTTLAAEIYSWDYILLGPLRTILAPTIRVHPFYRLFCVKFAKSAMNLLVLENYLISWI